QLARVLAADPDDRVTAPERCNHCQFCEFEHVCDAQWRHEDSLQFVARILRADRLALTAADHPTLASLAACDVPVDGIPNDRQARLIKQAGLQLVARQRDEAIAPPIQHLPPVTEGPPTGFLAMPEPDDGDVFLDYEGHPFWRADSGLFFLFGLLMRSADGPWRYSARWAHDRAGEATLTKELIEDMGERRRLHPGMHVYHYNHTERSSLERLATEHTVGEAALASLIETGLFVDLLTVVTNAMQVGVESYGLKHIERLTGFQRSHDIDAGAGAVVEYDAFCKDGDPARLAKIARYNEDDVQATMALRDWLLTERPADMAWRVAVIEPAESTYPDIDAQVEALHAFPADSGEYLLGDLLGFWLREGRAVFGALIAKTNYDLGAQLEDREVLGGLQFIREIERLGKNGKVLTPAIQLSVPDQIIGRKLRAGAGVIFGAGDELIGFSTLDPIDDGSGVVQLTWSDRCRELGVTPTSVVLNDWVRPSPKPEALSALAGKVLACEISDPASHVALAILRRESPRFVSGGGPTGGVFTDSIADMQRWALQLENSYVAIQGPPGTGKTYTGAHLVHALVLADKRVGVTAMSHHAIDNLYDEIVRVFTEAGDLDRLHAIRKIDASNDKKHDGIVKYTTSNDQCLKPDYNVIGGTTWLFARDDMRIAPVDVLIIDEAGQLALADALAAVGSARNVVMLGDPLQLAHVSKGTHPGKSGRSVLEHVLGEQTTIQPGRGVFLHTPRRMHPTITSFISQQFYEGRLESHPSCAIQDIDGRPGLRWLRAEHVGCSTESREEAAIVVDAISDLIDRQWTDAKGQPHDLTVRDFMVVAPYNDQVALLRSALNANPRTAGVRVGTVDKFQGQEAPVVFFSMTASTAADIPRGIDFLFSKNRLNVAVSRTRVLVHVVCTDQLLDSRARTVPEMELIAALCSFVEEANRQSLHQVTD
ncbi:MAG: hypothetical protein JWN99_2518, partial [Ilumatobacteraceae bacterium]|nr:hypothetical protein [Ilumatobacteraceae bacterium]